MSVHGIRSKMTDRFTLTNIPGRIVPNAPSQATLQDVGCAGHET